MIFDQSLLLLPDIETKLVYYTDHRMQHVVGRDFKQDVVFISLVRHILVLNLKKKTMGRLRD